MGTGSVLHSTVKTNAQGTGCAIAVLSVVAVGCLLLGVSLLRMALRPFVSYEQTTCTVVDKRLDSSQSRDRDGGSTTMYTPQVTFTYEVGGRPFRHTGYSAMTISSGSRKAEQEVLDGFTVGGTYPCWYDPSEPSEAVLTRARPAALVFGVFPLVFAAVFGFVAYLLSGIGKSPKRRAKGSTAAQVHTLDGGIELAGRSRSGRELLGLAAFALVWNGFVGVFVTLTITRAPEDMPIWVKGVLGLFALIGVLMLQGVASQALRLLRGKRPGVTLDAADLRPGSRLSGRLRLRGPQPARSTVLSLVASETVTTTRRTGKGTHTTVRTEERHDQTLLEVEPGRILAGETIEREFEAVLPESLARREWSWCLQVRTSTGGQPLVHEFPLDRLIEA